MEELSFQKIIHLFFDGLKMMIGIGSMCVCVHYYIHSVSWLQYHGTHQQHIHSTRIVVSKQEKWAFFYGIATFEMGLNDDRIKTCSSEYCRRRQRMVEDNDVYGTMVFVLTNSSVHRRIFTNSFLEGVFCTATMVTNWEATKPYLYSKLSLFKSSWKMLEVLSQLSPFDSSLPYLRPF